MFMIFQSGAEVSHWSDFDVFMTRYRQGASCLYRRDAQSKCSDYSGPPDAPIIAGARGREAVFFQIVFVVEIPACGEP